MYRGGHCNLINEVNNQSAKTTANDGQLQFKNVTLTDAEDLILTKY